MTSVLTHVNYSTGLVRNVLFHSFGFPLSSNRPISPPHTPISLFAPFIYPFLFFPSPLFISVLPVPISYILTFFFLYRLSWRRRFCTKHLILIIHSCTCIYKSAIGSILFCSMSLNYEDSCSPHICAHHARTPSRLSYGM